jgi:hypothetical protein
MVDLATRVAEVRRLVGDLPPKNNGNSVGRLVVLALAWPHEVNAFYDHAREMSAPESRRVYDLAIEMARTGSLFADDDAHRLICAAPHPPIYATIRPPGIRDPWITPDKYAPVVQAMMGDARPLWVNYIPLAEAELARRDSTPAHATIASLVPERRRPSPAA